METNNTRPIFAWYKERLQTKYLKAPTSKNSSISSCWRFVNVNLDDFSDCSSLLCGAQIGVSPVIFHGAPHHNSGQMPQKCISKEHACFSKQMIQKQIRREYVAAVEERLKQHPLDMYPHYKDHMNPELFDKVVSVLDPDMCVNSAPTPTEDHAQAVDDEPSKGEVEKAKHRTPANKISPDVQNPSPRNPYVLQKKGNCVKNGWIAKVNQLRIREDMKVTAKPFSKPSASPVRASEQV